MKVLFLDIDEVLNRKGTRERHMGFRGIDRELSDLFVRWLEGRDVKIVLATSWRNWPGMTDAITAAGITWIGETPYLRGNLRGDEVKAWLDLHPEVTRYAILDDRSDLLPEQMPYHVQTDYEVGLKPEHLDKLTEILGD